MTTWFVGFLCLSSLGALAVNDTETISVGFGYNNIMFYLNSCPSHHEEIHRICKTPQGSCGTRCGQVKDITKGHLCHCDYMCLAYGDCCGDYHHKCSEMRISFFHGFKRMWKIGAACIDGYKVIDRCPEGVALNESKTMEPRHGHLQPFVASTSQPTLHFKNASVHECHFRDSEGRLTDDPMPWHFVLQADVEPTVAALQEFLNNDDDDHDDNDNNDGRTTNASVRIRALPVPPERSSAWARQCDATTGFSCRQSWPGDADLCAREIKMSELFFQIVCGGSAMLTITTLTSFEPPEITSLAHPVTDSLKEVAFQSCKVRHGSLFKAASDPTVVSRTVLHVDKTSGSDSFFLEPWVPYSSGAFCRVGDSPGDQCHLSLNCSSGYFSDGFKCVQPSRFSLSILADESNTTDWSKWTEERVVDTLLGLFDWQLEPSLATTVHNDEDQTVNMTFVSQVSHYDLPQNLAGFNLYVTGAIAHWLTCEPRVSLLALRMSACLYVDDVTGLDGGGETCDELNLTLPFSHRECLKGFGGNLRSSVATTLNWNWGWGWSLSYALAVVLWL